MGGTQPGRLMQEKGRYPETGRPWEQIKRPQVGMKEEYHRDIPDPFLSSSGCAMLAQIKSPPAARFSSCAFLPSTLPALFHLPGLS